MSNEKTLRCLRYLLLNTLFSNRDVNLGQFLSSEELILLGHGLKDIGNKDSFVVRLNRDMAANMIDEVIQSFDRKWAAATKLP